GGRQRVWGRAWIFRRGHTAGRGGGWCGGGELRSTFASGPARGGETQEKIKNPPFRPRHATTAADSAVPRVHLRRTGRGRDVYLADGARNLTRTSRRTGPRPGAAGVLLARLTAGGARQDQEKRKPSKCPP